MIHFTDSIGFCPAIKTITRYTINAKVSFTSGRIKLDTHQGTLDLSTAAAIKQLPPSIIQALYQLRLC